MQLGDYAKLSSLELLVAEVQGKVTVTRYKRNKPQKRHCVLTMTKTTRANNTRKIG